MATAKQIAANRANSQKSTGAISEAGKRTVSQNRTTHGLCGQFRVLACENQADYDALLVGLTEAEQPANAAEVECVVRMAKHTWLANRALRMQDSSFTIEPRTDRQKEAGIHPFALNPIPLEHAMRYHTLHDRAYHRACQELMQRRKQRQLTEIGFERKEQAEADQKRKSEKHEANLEIATLRRQILELRFNKAMLSLVPAKIAKDPAFQAVLGKKSDPQEAKVGA